MDCGEVPLHLNQSTAYIGDYPEQVLVTLVKTGQCPVCPASRHEMGDLDSKMPPRDTAEVQRALATIDQGARIFSAACKVVAIKPVQSVFWLNLPHIDIYSSITPDLLHQLYQGVFKHLLKWIEDLCGKAEIDARCRRLPPNHHIRLFMKGITHLSRVTGMEHDQISRFLLALVADIRLPDGSSSARLVRCTRALLDFMYLARYPIHTTETLDRLDSALRSFHDNKDIFTDFGIRDHFNIPKVHSLCHYRDFIELFGAADNFNTEYSERLHIELAKDAYAATNYKDEYPQMTAFLDIKEKVMQHEKFIRREMDTNLNSPQHIIKPPPCLIPQRRLHMAKHPTKAGVTLEDVATDYGATDFTIALKRYVVRYLRPDLTSRNQIDAAAYDLHLPMQKVPVFHRVKFVSFDAYALDPLNDKTVDSIHIEPAHLDKYGKTVPGRFDTALISLSSDGESGMAISALN